MAFPERDPFGQEDERQLLEVLASQNAFFPSGTKVHEFERSWRELYGVHHAVCSTSGTSAIHVDLGTFNLDPDDIERNITRLAIRIRLISAIGVRLIAVTPIHGYRTTASARSSW